MESTVKHSMRKCGITNGDSIAMYLNGNASSIMMKRIFTKVLGRNPSVKIKSMKNPDSSAKEFTKVAVPETCEEAAAFLLKSLAGISLFHIKDKKIIRPMSGISMKEAKLYCRLNGMPFQKSRDDAFIEFVRAMEARHPGVSNQAVRFLEKMKD